MRLLKLFKWLFVLGLIVVVIGGAGVALVLYHYSKDLPDHQQLAKYEPPIVTRIHAGDGELIGEYADQKRLFMPIESMPKRVTDAFIAAEDAAYYTHMGINPMSILRASIQNVGNYLNGRRLIGASTITQQVAKNFLLTNEAKLERKIREAMIAIRMNERFSKDYILELYLNEIYLGRRSHGVAAAALTYFDKSLDELTIEEAAYLASLPKAPSNYDPDKHYDRALTRRNWVIGRMAATGAITEDEAFAARSHPLKVVDNGGSHSFRAGWFTEEVRRELAEEYGTKKLYSSGFSVRTTVDTELQADAQTALRDGLMRYDRRHGYRGPVVQFETMDDWRKQLRKVMKDKGRASLRKGWRYGAVLAVTRKKATIGFASGEKVELGLSAVKWARKALKKGAIGKKITRVSDVLNVADVVLVGPDPVALDKAKADIKAGKVRKKDAFTDIPPALVQVPAANGGVVALDPRTGRVLALVGGWSYGDSQYNRATQAARQPGSSFKPFVYAAALENGFNPSSIILDAPFVIDQGAGQGLWKPSNYTNRFYGPSTMRLGLEKSRNLMTVRLAQQLGMETVSDYARRFGIYDDMPAQLSYSLGAGETTLLKMTTAYAMLVNGGKRIEPRLIDRVQDRYGKNIQRHDPRQCEACTADAWTRADEPDLPDRRPQVIDRISAYQLVSMLEGVVLRGTAAGIRQKGLFMAGKTGTTNESRDAWFVGFTPEIAVGVFVGFDKPQTLGKREGGGSVAAPIFRDVVLATTKGGISHTFRVPEGVRLVRVDGRTGQRSRARTAIMEAFRRGQEPKLNRARRTSSTVLPAQTGKTAAPSDSGTDGLY